VEKIQRALDKARKARAATLLAPPREAPAAAAAAEPVVEKFQKALDKAREERAAALSARPAEAAPGPAAEVQPGPAAATAAVPDSTGLTIDYRQTRVLPSSPRVLQRSRVVAASVDSFAADAFRILRTQVLARLDARQGRAVAICAASKGNGKTLVAANLAASFARQLTRSAILVDFDLRNPSVHRCFGLSPECGLSDYLLGRRRLDECLINPGIERLVLLPQASRLPHSSELLTSPRMASLAQELKGRYPDRVVIYDCPPLLLTNDPLLAMEYADGCLLVVQEGKTSKTEFLRAAELVGEHRYLGTVFNDARWSSGSTYYR
jgi:protein-tyrosine kinase